MLLCALELRSAHHAMHKPRLELFEAPGLCAGPEGLLTAQLLHVLRGWEGNMVAVLIQHCSAQRRELLVRCDAAQVLCVCQV